MVSCVVFTTGDIPPFFKNELFKTVLATYVLFDVIKWTLRFFYNSFCATRSRRLARKKASIAVIAASRKRIDLPELASSPSPAAPKAYGMAFRGDEPVELMAKAPKEGSISYKEFTARRDAIRTHKEDLEMTTMPTVPAVPSASREAPQIEPRQSSSI